MMNIDSTSAAGVTSALNSTMATIHTRQLRTIVRAGSIPTRFATTTNTGRVKATPVANMSFTAKST